MTGKGADFIFNIFNLGSLCRYLLKQDEDGQPFVWGAFSLESIRSVTTGAIRKRARKVRRSRGRGKDERP